LARALARQLEEKTFGFREHALLVPGGIKDRVAHGAAEIDDLLTKGSLGTRKNPLYASDDLSADVSVDAFLREDFSVFFQKNPSPS
jgi:hypothetical protein